jgi:hypothetical protein
MNWLMSLLFGALAYSQSWLFVPTPTSSFTPASLSGLVLWLDSTDSSKITLSGSSVTSWTDKSSSGYVLNSSGSNVIYHTSGLGTSNAAYLAFNGTDILTSTTNFIDQSSGINLTIFWVSQVNAVGTVTWGLGAGIDHHMPVVYQYGSSTEGYSVFDSGIQYTISTGTLALRTIIAPTSANATIRVNGSVPSQSGNVSGTGLLAAVIKIGSDAINDGHLNGYFGSFIIYNRVLNSTEIGQVETYLNGVYGIY